jgi:hypothetical protein
LGDAAGHEEALDEAEDGGDSGPGEEQVEDAEAIAVEIEVVDSEAAEEEREQDTDDLFLAGVLVLGKEPPALLIVHVGGIEVVDHGVGSFGEAV